MTKPHNDLLLRTIAGESTERTPVWLMRQAGRILPQYRALRARLSGFKELVETPELAAEVTVQPVDELHVDAAIIFSDILVIPEAMGLPYEMIEKRGPNFPTTITSRAQIDALRTDADAAGELTYVYDAIRATLRELDGRVPLIGFAGAPWTIFCYMVEGSGSKTFSKAKRLLYQDAATSHALLEKITAATIAYLQQKIAAGVHVVQLFDSWASILGPELYRTFSLPYLQQICDAIDQVPVTVFAKGAWSTLREQGELSCATLGLDWQTTPEHARRVVGDEKILQGNLDPCQLYATPDQVRLATRELLGRFGGHRHIANLGHGVYPDTPLESVRAFVDTVRETEGGAAHPSGGK